MNFFPKHQSFLWRRCTWKCCLQNGDHFVQSSMGQMVHYQTLTRWQHWSEQYLAVQLMYNFWRIKLPPSICKNLQMKNISSNNGKSQVSYHLFHVKYNISCYAMIHMLIKKFCSVTHALFKFPIKHYNRVCHPGGHHWEYLAGTLLFSRVTETRVAVDFIWVLDF